MEFMYGNLCMEFMYGNYKYGIHVWKLSQALLVYGFLGKI